MTTCLYTFPVWDASAFRLLLYLSLWALSPASFMGGFAKCNGQVWALPWAIYEGMLTYAVV